MHYTNCLKIFIYSFNKAYFNFNICEHNKIITMNIETMSCVIISTFKHLIKEWKQCKILFKNIETTKMITKLIYKIIM